MKVLVMIQPKQLPSFQGIEHIRQLAPSVPSFVALTIVILSFLFCSFEPGHFSFFNKPTAYEDSGV